MKTRTYIPSSPALPVDQSMSARFRRSRRSLVKFIARNKVKSAVLFTAFFTYEGNAALRAMAQAASCEGFLCSAKDVLGNNAVVNAGGQQAKDLINYPFVMLVIIAIFLLVILGLTAMGRLKDGRDWGDAVTVLIIAGCIIMFLTYMVDFLAKGLAGVVS